MESNNRLYFNVEQNNNTDNPINADYDSGFMDVPFIESAEKYEVSVVRFRIPSSMIPIFDKNIEYESLQVGLMAGNYMEVVEPVAQYGAKLSPQYYYSWINSSTTDIYRYTSNNGSYDTSTMVKYSLPNTGLTNGGIRDLVSDGDFFYLAMQGNNRYHYLLRLDENFENPLVLASILIQNPITDSSFFKSVKVNQKYNMLIAVSGEPNIYFFDLTTHALLLKTALPFNPQSMITCENFLYVANNRILQCYSINRGDNDFVLLRDNGSMANYNPPLGNNFTYLALSPKRREFYVLPRVSTDINHPIYTWYFTADPDATISRTYTFPTSNFVSQGIATDDYYLYVNRAAEQDVICINIESGSITSSNPFPTGVNLYGGYVETPTWMESGQPIYKIAEFTSVINDAYTRAFNRLNNLTPLTGLQPPKVLFDANTKLFSIYANQEYLSTNTTIFMNPKLYNYFDFLGSVDASLFPDDVGYDLRTFYNIKIIDNYVNQIVVGGKTYLQMIQEGSSLGKINQLCKIVIKTNLPVYGDTQSSGAKVKYLSDFVVDTSSFIPGQPIILYPSLLRLCSLYSNTEIRQIAVSAWYSTNNQDFMPIQIQNGESWSLKMEYRAKSLGGSSF